MKIDSFFAREIEEALAARQQVPWYILTGNVFGHYLASRSAWRHTAGSSPTGFSSDGLPTTFSGASHDDPLARRHHFCSSNPSISTSTSWPISMGARRSPAKWLPDEPDDPDKPDGPVATCSSVPLRIRQVNVGLKQVFPIRIEPSGKSDSEISGVGASSRRPKSQETASLQLHHRIRRQSRNSSLLQCLS